MSINAPSISIPRKQRRGTVRTVTSSRILGLVRRSDRASVGYVPSSSLIEKASFSAGYQFGLIDGPARII